VSPAIPILGSVVCSVVGQLILKAGMTSLGPLGLADRRVVATIVRIFSRPAIVGGFALYGLGLLFWLVALSQVELGYAYPFISLSYVLIVAASWALFGEELSAMKLFGVASICLGVLVIAAGQ
jgi:multidrug transporter EmrE-like cation transporter